MVKLKDTYFFPMSGRSFFEGVTEAGFHWFPRNAVTRTFILFPRPPKNKGFQAFSLALQSELRTNSKSEVWKKTHLSLLHIKNKFEIPATSGYRLRHTWCTKMPVMMTHLLNDSKLTGHRSDSPEISDQPVDGPGLGLLVVEGKLVKFKNHFLSVNDIYSIWSTICQFPNEKFKKRFHPWRSFKPHRTTETACMCCWISRCCQFKLGILW